MTTKKKFCLNLWVGDGEVERLDQDGHKVASSILDQTSNFEVNRRKASVKIRRNPSRHQTNQVQSIFMIHRYD